MVRSRLVAVVVLALASSACAEQGPPDDGAAVAACRVVLEQLAGSERLATTVRAEGSGFVVNAWRDGKPDGSPDYLCDVARDDDAERGVSVVKVQTRDSSGSGYRSSLDLDFDDDDEQ